MAPPERRDIIAQRELIKELVKEELAAHRAELLSGFPNGDAIDHCRYHEEQIKWMESRRKLYDSVREKTIAGMVWVVLAAVAALLLEYAKAFLQRVVH